MLRILLPLLFIISFESLCQFKEATINSKYEKAPFYVAKSPIKLARYLTENDTSDYQKALNIYTWIVHKIKYDVKAFKKVKSKTYSSYQTLKRKKGLCEQYSALFTALCINAGISSKQIIGYSRGFSYHENDKFVEADHTWNSVKIDSIWYLVDPTWGSGKIQQKKRWLKELRFQWFKNPFVNDKYKFIQEPDYQYFLVNPKFLIINHLPADPNWQLLENPISLATFESSSWKSYSGEIDSLFQKQMNLVDYTQILDGYKFLSGLQYMQITAKRSYEFNPKNYKLLGISSYLNAKSFQNVQGTPDKKLEAYNLAIKTYKESIVQLENHKRIAKRESKKAIQKINNTISEKLTKPNTKRLKKTNSAFKESVNLLNNHHKVIARNRIEILQLQKIVSEDSKTFELPSSIKSEEPEMIIKNNLKIASINEKLIQYQDSTSNIIRGLKDHLVKKKMILLETSNQYLNLIPLVNLNINSIAQNQELSQMCKAMHAIDSLGVIIDSLLIEKSLIDQCISREKVIIQKLHYSAITYSIDLQNTILNNCRISQNKNCEESLYNLSAHRLKKIYATKIQLEKEFLNDAISESKICWELRGILEKAQILISINASFISLFQDKRISEINFKLEKSNYHTDLMISDSKKNYRNLLSETFQLKSEIKKN